jgi:hypothetical protein
MVLFLLGGAHFLSFPPPLGLAHVPPFFSPQLKLMCAAGAPNTVSLPAATSAPSLTRARSKQANPTRLHHGYHSFFPPCTQSFFQPPLPLHRRALATAACITPLPVCVAKLVHATIPLLVGHNTPTGARHPPPILIFFRK